MKTNSIIPCIVAAFFATTLVQAQVPGLINYNGKLFDGNGVPVEGTATISLKLFDAQTGGSQIYSENLGSVTVSKGVYSFVFGTAGSGIAAALDAASEHWLELTINGQAQVPRQRLVAVPFATKALSAVTAGLNAAAEARLRVLEDNFLVTTLDGFAYRGTSKPATSSTMVWESFPVSAGTNGRVTAATDESYGNTQYNALAVLAQDLPVTRLPQGQILSLYKTVTVNAKPQRAEAQFFYFMGTSATGTARITFRYADSTSASTDFTVPANSLQTFSATNPSPTKIVTAVDYYNKQVLSGGGADSYVLNAKVVGLGQASVTISLLPQPTNWTTFRLSAIGSRESGDSITYSITNGTTTLSNLPIDTVQSWTGSSAPTSLTVTLTPSASATFGGTSLNTLAIFFNL